MAAAAALSSGSGWTCRAAPGHTPPAAGAAALSALSWPPARVATACCSLRIDGAHASSLRPLRLLPSCSAAAAPGRRGAAAAVVGFVFQPGGSQPDRLPHPPALYEQQQRQQLAQFPALPDAQQQLVCAVLGLAVSDAQVLLLSCPAASSMSHEQLDSSWRMLQQLLPVPEPQLLQAMLQLPELLPQPQHTVAARLASAAAALGVRPAQLRSATTARTAGLHWRLVVTPQQQLVVQLAQLKRLLGPSLQQRQLVGLLCAEPRLLAVDAAALLSSIEALEQVCGLPLPRLLPQLLRQPRPLARPAGELYAAATSLQQLLRLSEEGLALVLKRCPAAIAVPPSRVQQLVQQLSVSLSAGPDVAADILLQEPELLTRNPGAVDAVLGVLRSTFSLSADALMQVVQFDPSILCLPPGELAQGTRQFKRLALSNADWAREYKHLMARPANVARALRIEPLRLQRLVFLQRECIARGISLRAALTLSGRRFVRAYPSYRAWLAANYSAGAAPRRYDVHAPPPPGGAVASGAYEEEEDDDETDDDDVRDF